MRWFESVKYKDPNAKIPHKEDGNCFSVNMGIHKVTFICEDGKWACFSMEDGAFYRDCFDSHLSLGIVMTTSQLYEELSKYRQKENNALEWVNSFGGTK